MSKVSVIVPFYNVESYIDECLNSLVSQSYKDIEIIAVDDCSPDHSIDFVISYANKDNRVKVVRHSENMGLGGARNTGLKHATGDYICFVDSDDYVSRTFVEKLYKSAIDNKADVSICGYCCVEGNIKIPCHQEYTMELIEIADNKNNVLTTVNSYSSASWFKLYKKELIIGNNIFQPEKAFYEDVVFWLKVVFYSRRISVIPDRLYNYRQRHDSIMNSLSVKHIEDRMFFINEIDNFVKSVILETSGIDKINQINKLFLYLLKHINYGFTLTGEAMKSEGVDIEDYYEDLIRKFSCENNWPGIIAALDIYNENLTLAKKLKACMSELNGVQ